MDTLDAILQRRSIKFFDKQDRIDAKVMERLFTLTMLSPSAFNIQHWRFVWIQDTLLRKKLRLAAWNQAQVTDAAELVVLCVDQKAWDKNPERYWQNAPENVQTLMLDNMQTFYQDKELMQRDEAMRSAGIAAQTFMLAAKAMGYDTCPMDGFDFEQVANLIHLPDDHLIAMFIAVGKPAQSAFPKPGTLHLKDIMVYNHF